MPASLAGFFDITITMAEGFSLNGFVIRADPQLFLQYCEKNSIPIKVSKGLTEEESRDKIVEQIRELDENTRSNLEFGLQQIYVLAPNEGSHALVEEAISRNIDFPKEEVDGYDSQDKALWFYLNRKNLFDEIAAWQEVNDKQGWKELINLKKIKMEKVLGKETALKEQLSSYLFDTQLRGKNCAVECYKQKDRVCYVAYPEGYTESVILYRGNRFKKGEPFKPADKIFFLYYPNKGRLSTKASGSWKTKQEYQKIFGRAVLGYEIDIASDRVFNLDILKSKGVPFKTPKEDNIEYVKVKALNIRYFGGAKKVRLEVNGENNGIKDIHDLMTELGINPGGILISKAEFQVKFPSKIAHSSGSLTFYVSWPNSHNINDNPRYSKAKKYLKKWGLEQSFEDILDKVFDPNLVQKATTFELDKSLTSSFRYWLRDNKIISQDGRLSEWFCDDCNTSHTIQSQGRGLFYLCKGNKIFLPKYNTQLWKFNYPRLIKSLAEKLGLDSPTKEIVSEKLWQVGRIKTDKQYVDVYYSHKSPVLDNIVGNKIIITPGESKKIDDETYQISLGDVLHLDKSGVVIDKEYFEQVVLKVFKPVLFKENGDFVVDGTKIGSIKPTSPQYYFILCLWENFDVAVSHEDIFSHCKKKFKKVKGAPNWGEYVPQTFCTKMRALAKDNIKREQRAIFDEVVVSTKTTNGDKAYRMTNP